MHEFLFHRSGALAGAAASRLGLVGAAAILLAGCCYWHGAFAAPPVAAAPASAPTASGTPRQLAHNVQGVARAGLTVRVKGIELGEDATSVTLSASFANRATNFTELASVDTFLEDAEGNRLMLKRPQDNPYLKIQDGETMEGKLVFLGAVPPSANQVRLVFNHGNRPENTDGPGLTMTLPLAPQPRQ